MNNYKKTKYLLIVAMGIFILAQPAAAVRLYLEPAESAFQFGSTARLAMKIDTEDECINVIEAEIMLPRGLLDVSGISTGNSFLSLWVEEPNFDADKGLIHFIGGIPGGYCGSVSINRNVDTILELFIRSSTDLVDSFMLEILDTSQVLLHDGIGTPARLSTEGALLSFVDIGEDISDEWKVTLFQDVEPPDPFEVEIISDPSLFGGQYTAIFYTTDNQSGIDHYEVKETTEHGYWPNTKKPAGWQVAASPYLLHDQSLGSLVHVKAVDKAGNETIAEYIPAGFNLKDKKLAFNRIILIFGAILILLLLIFLRLAFKHLHNHNHNK